MINSRGSSQIISLGIFTCVNVFGQRIGVKCFIDCSRCLLRSKKIKNELITSIEKLLIYGLIADNDIEYSDVS